MAWMDILLAGNDKGSTATPAGVQESEIEHNNIQPDLLTRNDIFRGEAGTSSLWWQPDSSMPSPVGAEQTMTDFSERNAPSIKNTLKFSIPQRDTHLVPWITSDRYRRPLLRLSRRGKTGSEKLRYFAHIKHWQLSLSLMLPRLSESLEHSHAKDLDDDDDDDDELYGHDDDGSHKEKVDDSMDELDELEEEMEEFPISQSQHSAAAPLEDLYAGWEYEQEQEDRGHEEEYKTEVDVEPEEEDGMELVQTVRAPPHVLSRINMDGEFINNLSTGEKEPSRRNIVLSLLSPLPGGSFRLHVQSPRIEHPTGQETGTLGHKGVSERESFMATQTDKSLTPLRRQPSKSSFDSLPLRSTQTSPADSRIYGGAQENAAPMPAVPLDDIIPVNWRVKHEKRVASETRIRDGDRSQDRRMSTSAEDVSNLRSILGDNSNDLMAYAHELNDDASESGTMPNVPGSPVLPYFSDSGREAEVMGVRRKLRYHITDINDIVEKADIRNECGQTESTETVSREDQESRYPEPPSSSQPVIRALLPPTETIEEQDIAPGLIHLGARSGYQSQTAKVSLHFEHAGQNGSFGSPPGILNSAKSQKVLSSRSLWKLQITHYERKVWTRGLRHPGFPPSMMSPVWEEWWAVLTRRKLA